MNSLYGNIGWQFYVYGTYAVVVLLLFIYVFFSIISRRNAVKNLLEEGFLEDKNSENHYEKKI